MTINQVSLERKKKKDSLIMALKVFSARLEEKQRTIEFWRQELRVMQDVIKKKLGEL